MSDKDQITVENVQFVEGPIAPGLFGLAGISDPAKIKEALVKKFGPEKAEQVWPLIERMIIAGVQKASEMGGNVEAKGEIPL